MKGQILSSRDTSLRFYPSKGRRPKNYALKTLPHYFAIKPSSIPGAGLGVWSKQVIEKRFLLGPYEGVRIHSEPEAHKSGYCWEVCKLLASEG